jgi:hypothetical protein
VGLDDESPHVTNHHTSSSTRLTDCLFPRIAKSRAYNPPKTLGFRPELRTVRKELESQYYQLMTGHAVIAPYIKEKIKSDSDECRWCQIGKRQSRERLFKECMHWKDEIKALWRRVEKDVGWKWYHWKPISSLFNENKATGATLEFLDKTGVGKMAGGLGHDEYGADEDEE